MVEVGIVVGPFNVKRNNKAMGLMGGNLDIKIDVLKKVSC